MVKSKQLKEIEKLSSILEVTNIGVWEWNIKSGNTIFNERWAEIIGYSIEELTPTTINTWTNLAHPEDLITSAALLEKHISGELDYYECEVRMRHKNGKWVWILDRGKVSSWAGDGKPLLMLGTHQDITKRKLAEYALKIEIDNLNNIFNSMLDGVYIVTQDFDIRYVNPILQKELGCYKGQKCYEYFHHSKEICPWCKIEEVLAGKTIRREWFSEKKQKAYDLIGSPLKDFDGSTLKLEILRDVTEHKQAKEALQKNYDELEQRVIERTEELKKLHEQLLHVEKLAAVGRFSASIAHEFNNPLCGVINAIDGISMRAKLNENDQMISKLALHECDRMKRLIANLQQFNKPSTGIKCMVNIPKVIDAILFFSKNALENKKATIIKAIPQNLPEIWVVPDQIKQVLINLIDNASDALGDCGTITIAAASSGKNKITISISDTGEGIDPASLEQIFEPFYTTKAVKGTGLGLSVSYGIIKNHNGKIEVNSELGNGTTFTLTLPLK